jgi:ABC-type multidrug transport system fused ATPase/permease subunit
MFLLAISLGAYGVITNWIWGLIVVRLENGGRPVELLAALVVCLTFAPLALAEAIRRYPHWWIAVMLRTRTSVLIGQTDQRRLPPTPPGEVVARAMDCDRYTRYADRWVDFVLGLAIAAMSAIFAGTLLAGAVLLAVMALTAVTSAMGSPAAGRSAAAASTARAGFGRALVSSLDAIRTVKLSAATASVHEHLRRVDGGRVDAAVREHRIQSALDGVPVVMVQSGVVAAWAIHVAGWWGLSTALLVSGAVAGFEWFGRVAGSVITEAPGTRAWQQETSRLAGGRELMAIPADVDLVHGSAMRAEAGASDRLERLELVGFGAVHDDGTVGASGVDLAIARGDLVLVLGRIGSGKSSLLRALAGLVHPTGTLTWNGRNVDDLESFLRPHRVAYVAQIPRVLSGTFVDNVRLDHDRDASWSIEHARLSRDIAHAGGHDVAVGHRGVRLSGGQVQRLALARALATDSELLVADDVSSALDASTEVELWDAMRASGRTVIGATTKRSALQRADHVVVMVDGTVAAQGPWADLARTWDHLAG